MTTDEVKMLIDSKQIPDDIALQLAKELLQAKREIAACNRKYEPLYKKAFFYIYCEVSTRDTASLKWGVIDDNRANVRARNDIVEIGRRLASQFVKNSRSTLDQYEVGRAE